MESHARAEENYRRTDKFSPGYSLMTISTGMSLDGVGNDGSLSMELVCSVMLTGPQQILL